MAALFGSQSIHSDLYEFSVDSSHLVKRTSFQDNPGGIKNLCLLADIPSRARFAEDSCPEGLTWLEAALFSKMCLQCLSPTLFHYTCALLCAGFCTCLEDNNITGIQHKNIWARRVAVMANPGVEQA